jgi:hypothetical protein
VIAMPPAGLGIEVGAGAKSVLTILSPTIVRMP